MGYYINPITGTKKEWLEQNGQKTQEPDWPPPTRQILVCLVDNGSFTAAGIAYDQQEWMEFIAPDATPEEIKAAHIKTEGMGVAFYSLDLGNQRPRTWYLVPRDKIIEVCPSVESRI